MSIELKIDAGQNAGIGGFQKELELVSLLVNIRDKKTDIMYEEYTLIDGEKIKPRILMYSLIDGVPQVNQSGQLIQAKNTNGTPAFEDVEEQEKDENGELLFNEDETPKMIVVSKPKYLTQQFTRWVSAFKPYIWDAAGTLKDGIKEDYGI